MPTLGGQTALNTAMELHRNGALEKHDVEMIGANAEAIAKGEDRQIFKDLMLRIGLDVPSSGIAHSLADRDRIVAEIGLSAHHSSRVHPRRHRRRHRLQSRRIRRNRQARHRTFARHEVLIEESLLGWKEYEMEVMRDRADNCVIICSIENFDPMGVHTGDSITVAPIQTLTDKEYQIMRDAAFAVIRAVGVETGGSNIQFGVHPENGRMVIIEMNPRVSRSVRWHRRRPVFRLRRSPPNSPSATCSTKSKTTSRAKRRRASSRRLITAWSKSRASPSKNFRKPTRRSPRR